ncbi:MAG: alkaline phosphatase D family protein [Caulobacteraceae bacterium]|nr:alkaline phosphatase D family protein [Caulobacteraceae bacterium]
MKIDRRQALGLLGLGASPAMAAPLPLNKGKVEFRHGVASGDPATDHVVFWTRVTPADPEAGDVLVDLEVAADPQFKTMARTSQGLRAKADRDFTIKHDLDGQGLKPGTDYWYRFRARHAGVVSPIGRTRTLAAGGEAPVTLAVASCALFPNGYFNAYQAIAELETLDAVLHLGDYIYEYGGDKSYGMDSPVAGERRHDPDREILSLDDYRRRHAQYKSDPQLQAAHARAPWIVVWDDHETANDSYAFGAQNHQPAEGDWAGRKAAALKAYFEWMPIREPGPGQGMAEAANRSFHFGEVASLIMLETRLAARDKPLSYADLGDAPSPEALEAFRGRMNDPGRRMMSAAQEAWVGEELSRSVQAGRTWQVLGNQVIMARAAVPSPSGIDPEARRQVEQVAGRLDRMERLSRLGLPYGLDMWDGYGAARDRLYGLMKDAGAHGVVVSGDSHAFWVNELWDAPEGGRRLAAEFGATGITSPGAGDALKGVPIGRLYAERNREVVFSEQATQGFVLLTLSKVEATAQLMAVSTIHAREFETSTLKTFATRPVEGGGVEAVVEV